MVFVGAAGWVAGAGAEGGAEGEECKADNVRVETSQRAIEASFPLFGRDRYRGDRRVGLGGPRRRTRGPARWETRFYPRDPRGRVRQGGPYGSERHISIASFRGDCRFSRSSSRVRPCECDGPGISSIQPIHHSRILLNNRRVSGHSFASRYSVDEGRPCTEGFLATVGKPWQNALAARSR